MHPGQKLKPGARVLFERDGRALHGEVLERLFYGRRRIRLTAESGTVAEAVDAIGHIPLPPYIHRPDTAADRERYQTVFASHRGSIAAPTAGLHFDTPLLAALDAAGVERVTITLHVGYGTFKPVRVEDVEAHVVDPEPYEISARPRRRRSMARSTRAAGRRRRDHDDARARARGDCAATEGSPPARARRISSSTRASSSVSIRGLLTNFHLPKSSLLMLVSALAGRERVLDAYREAVAERYRFYSYGDAMLVRFRRTTLRFYT